MFQPERLMPAVAFDHAAAAAAREACERARQVAAAVRESRRRDLGEALVGWEGRLRALVEQELATLDARLEEGDAALAALAAAVDDLARRAARLQDAVEVHNDGVRRSRTQASA
jgi:predicted  nucleic acid-binding Zn-ribbon protein